MVLQERYNSEYFTNSPLQILTYYRPAMTFGNRKINFRGSLQLNIVTIQKKYHPSGTLKFNRSGISQRLKLCILVEKNPISLELNLSQVLLAAMGLRLHNLLLSVAKLSVVTT